MAIRVSHRPSAAAIGQAAFSAGRGRALQRERERQLAEQARFEMLERQQEQAEIGMQFQLAQQQQAQQARAGLQEQRQANALEQIQTRFELGQQDRRQQFTEKQHHQLQQLEAMQAAIEADSTLTPEMKERAKIEVQARMAGIQPPERQPPTAQEQAESAVVEIDGVKGLWDGNSINPIVDPNSKRATESNYAKSILEYADRLRQSETGNPNAVATKETIMQAAMMVRLANDVSAGMPMEDAEIAVADIRGDPDIQDADEQQGAGGPSGQGLTPQATGRVVASRLASAGVDQETSALAGKVLELAGVTDPDQDFLALGSQDGGLVPFTDEHPTGWSMLFSGDRDLFLKAISQIPPQQRDRYAAAIQQMVDQGLIPDPTNG